MKPRKGCPAAMCTSRLIRKSLLPTFGAPPSDQQPARRQHARRDDVLGHGRGVVEELAEGEGRHGGRAGCSPGPDERRPMLLDVARPEPLGLGLQPLLRPARPQHGGVVAADASQPSSGVIRPSCTRRRKWPIAALAPAKRVQPSTPPSRTGVVSTASSEGFSGVGTVANGESRRRRSAASRPRAGRGRRARSRQRSAGRSGRCAENRPCGRRCRRPGSAGAPSGNACRRRP